jgi:hypothetical protein
MSVTPLRSPSTISDLVGWFTGFSAEMNTSNQLTRWRDLSGKGNHVESSAMRSGSINLSASATNENVYDSPSTDDAKLGVTPFPYLYGSTDAGLQFPATMMTTTSDYTLFHVARYYKPGDAVPTRKRIFDGVTTNWLSGFHSSKSGVAYHNSWLMTPQTDIHGDTWVLSTDQKNMYRSNGTDRTSSGYSTGTSDQLSINYGSSVGSETSDWACAEVIVYDRELTPAEYEAVEAYLNAKYFSTNLEIPSTGPSVNESLTYDLNNDLGIGSYTVSPTLPDGLSKSGGILSGTLTRAGTYDFTLTGTTPVPGGIWTEQAKINADNSLFASYNFFGHTVSISSDGNTAIVGAYGQESAYIFIRSNGNWTQQAKIEASDKANGDNFGLGVAISGDGNTVIVGAPREDPGDPAVTNAGSAYIFTHANGNWTQQAKINGSGNVYIGSFGARVATVSISSDGNTAIVGAYGQESAYIYHTF